MDMERNMAKNDKELQKDVLSCKEYCKRAGFTALYWGEQYKKSGSRECMTALQTTESDSPRGEP